MHYMKYERSDAPTIRLPAWLTRFFLCCCGPGGKRGAYEGIPLQEMSKKGL